MPAGLRARTAASPTSLGSQPDRLDLDQLARVAERRDAEERARRSCGREALLDDAPDPHELGAIRRRDVDRRLQHLVDPGTCGLQRDLQVLDRRARLELVVA